MKNIYPGDLTVLETSPTIFFYLFKSKEYISGIILIPSVKHAAMFSETTKNFELYKKHLKKL